MQCFYIIGCLFMVGQLAYGKPTKPVLDGKPSKEVSFRKPKTLILEELDVNSKLAIDLANHALGYVNKHEDSLYYYQRVEIRSAYTLATYCECHQLEIVVVANTNCPKKEVARCDEKEVSASDKKFLLNVIITGSLKDARRYYQYDFESLN